MQCPRCNNKFTSLRTVLLSNSSSIKCPKCNNESRARVPLLNLVIRFGLIALLGVANNYLKTNEIEINKLFVLLPLFLLLLGIDVLIENMTTKLEPIDSDNA